MTLGYRHSPRAETTKAKNYLRLWAFNACSLSSHEINSPAVNHKNVLVCITGFTATMAAKTIVFLLLAICSFFTLALGSHTYQGEWKLLKKSIGISAMHMALLPNDRIVAFDWTTMGPSNITLPNGTCLKISDTIDCYAHSVEFNPANRNVRALTIRTDTWCSSGALAPDGMLVQSGGYDEGERVVRYFKQSPNSDWIEDPNGLITPRWYASNQILPNGKIIVVGGRDQFSYEFIPKSSKSDQTLYQLPFLEQTMYTKYVQNNLYPFTHLSPDGNLFIFANDRAILLDYVKNNLVRNYPVMPGGFSRNYPSTGSSVLLPIKLLKNINHGTPDAEVFICGGTLPHSNAKANEGVFLEATKTCGRLVITAANPKWEMEDMPINRVMGDMLLLPTGDVLIINGAARGAAGWGVAREPVLNPVLYNVVSKFEVLKPSKIPRVYHSTAHLLSDGRVLVGGSNPNGDYNFTTLFPTELSLEAFYPPYLSSNINKPRPFINWVRPSLELRYKQKFSLAFDLRGKGDIKKMYVTMVAPSFTTHSFAMNQRVLVLGLDQVHGTSSTGNFVVQGHAPATAAVAPPGYYLLFVVHDGVPSRGTWVNIK
ncbi:aldehyde oxidase GLOX1-like [Fagus crenata]